MQSFSKTLLQQQFRRFAWFHHPPAAELVLARFLRGELPPGDRQCRWSDVKMECRKIESDSKDDEDAASRKV